MKSNNINTSSFFLERTSIHVQKKKNSLLKYKINYTEIIWKVFYISHAIYRNNITVYLRRKKSPLDHLLTDYATNCQQWFISRHNHTEAISVLHLHWYIYIWRICVHTEYVIVNIKNCFGADVTLYIPNRTISTSTLPL